MSLYTNRSIVSLLNMVQEMHRKGIENSRVIKTAALLLMSGVSPSCINKKIIEYSLQSQQPDGGYIGNSDTAFNAVFLSYFPQYAEQYGKTLVWIQSNSDNNGGWGRTLRDMHRIPVTGLLLYILPQLSMPRHLQWLEQTWASELNSLTYKAAYTLAAFAKNNYKPQDKSIIGNTMDWLVSQQESDGGFAPWKNHPVGTNILYTCIAVLGLLAYGKNTFEPQILNAYRYMRDTQLPSGIWAFHEIEDGASWGLYAMTQVEVFFGNENI
jgi:hypothetical protein